MSANKLTDTQLVLLSAAARHPEGAIELASDLKGGAAKKAVGKLLREGLIEEIPARGALPVWRRDDDQGPLVLRITPHGLAAIGVEAGVTERKGDPHDAELASDRPLQRVNAAHRRKSRDEAPAQSAKPSSRDSKQARVVGMLQRQQGATIAGIMKFLKISDRSRAEEGYDYYYDLMPVIPYASASGMRAATRRGASGRSAPTRWPASPTSPTRRSSGPS